MALRLEIVGAHREKLGKRAIKEFGQDGGTLGRSLDNDWVLPDLLRYVSTRHASIDFRSGSYYIVDTSTNGVYVNDAEQPVGRGNPQRLFNGDRLRIGEYEMVVGIDDDHDAVDTLFDEEHVDPVDLAQRVASPEPTSRDLVDPYEITGVGLEAIIAADDDETSSTARLELLELELEDEASPPPATRQRPDTAPTPVRGAAPAAARAAAPPHKTDPTSLSAPDATPAAGNPTEAALAAFFRGAGLPAAAAAEQDPEHTLHRAGQLVRELILGVTESLHIRAEQKGTLRFPNTTIQRRANNPLKFAAGIDEALNNLFFRQSPEYLSAVEAVREALRDIKTHQQLLLSALPLAVADYIGRLDPDELEEKFSGGRRGALIGAANKLRYWDLYKDLYQVVANHEPGELPPQFVEELSRVYEQELSRLAPGAQPAAKHTG